MNKSLKSWIGQVTTGHGVMVLVPTVLAALTGTMGWNIALPLLAAGVVGLAWPENMAMQASARTVAEDVGRLMAAYRGVSGTKGPGG